MFTKKHFIALLFCLCFSHLSGQTVTDQIKLNQIGFYPSSQKIAVATGNTSAKTFYITSTNLKDTFFTGELGETKQSINSSNITRIADFTALQKRGSYTLLIPGVGHSYVFCIDNQVYKEAGISTLKGFYYQRASMPLEVRYAGKWHRSAGHPDTAVLIHPSAVSVKNTLGSKLSSPGGWYDAGDYNKYIVNSGISMATLFAAYEDFPAYFDTLQTNIPESRDQIPDILNEALYNLRWMFTMQDPDDGGVYHKCTNAAFDGMVMPGITTLPRYVVQKSTAATLDFAAVMAQAARIFQKYKKQLPGLEDSCITAAIKAWNWALKNPDQVYDQSKLNSTYQPKISTGEYGDNTFNDEWFWAASELYATTKNSGYHKDIAARMNDSFNLPSWANVGLLGYYTLVRVKGLPVLSNEVIKTAKQRLIELADNYIANATSNPFNTVIGGSIKDFVWGSNAVAANQSILLINAYLINGDKKYLGHALSNLDYLLGRNATGYCYVTGIGSKSTMHPHHRPSIADGITDPVPGLLAGGPNPGMQDKCHYDFTEPETAYTDADCSYASNEIAINWNAPIVYVANAIEALQKLLK